MFKENKFIYAVGDMMPRYTPDNSQENQQPKGQDKPNFLVKLRDLFAQAKSPKEKTLVGAQVEVDQDKEVAVKSQGADKAFTYVSAMDKKLTQVELANKQARDAKNGISEETPTVYSVNTEGTRKGSETGTIARMQEGQVIAASGVSRPEAQAFLASLTPEQKQNLTPSNMKDQYLAYASKKGDNGVAIAGGF